MVTAKDWESTLARHRCFKLLLPVLEVVDLAVVVAEQELVARRPRVPIERQDVVVSATPILFRPCLSQGRSIQLIGAGQTRQQLIRGRVHSLFRHS
jgi:hypothetical protein